MNHPRPARLALPAFGVALALLAGVVALALRSAACTPAPGSWLRQTAGVLGTYRQLCGEFATLPDEEDGFPPVVRYNNFGLNDANLSLDKPPGVFRIVLVGDSFPQGVQVEREQGFPWLLETLLNRDVAPVEVINLSVDAFGTDRELLLYAVLGWRFQPDLVLLALYPGNDIQDNQIDLEHRRYGYRLKRAYFTLADGRLRLHHSPTYDPAAYPDAPVWGWLAAMQAAQIPDTPENPPPRPAGVSQNPYTLEYPVELGLYLPEDAYWSNAWALTEALLLEFREVVTRGQGVPFAVVIIPDRRAVHDEDWAKLLDDYGGLLPALRQADPFTPAARLEAFLTAQGIPTLNLTWALRQEAEASGERLYYWRDGHFNARGHQVTARRLAAWLTALRLAP